jgi:hypothetical protein
MRKIKFTENSANDIQAEGYRKIEKYIRVCEELREKIGSVEIGVSDLEKFFLSGSIAVDTCHCKSFDIKVNLDLYDDYDSQVERIWVDLSAKDTIYGIEINFGNFLLAEYKGQAITFDCDVLESMALLPEYARKELATKFQTYLAGCNCVVTIIKPTEFNCRQFRGSEDDWKMLAKELAGDYESSRIFI